MTTWRYYIHTHTRRRREIHIHRLTKRVVTQCDISTYKECTSDFSTVINSENYALKRAKTNPREKNKNHTHTVVFKTHTHTHTLPLFFDCTICPPSLLLLLFCAMCGPVSVRGSAVAQVCSPAPPDSPPLMCCSSGGPVYTSEGTLTTQTEQRERVCVCVCVYVFVKSSRQNGEHSGNNHRRNCVCKHSQIRRHIKCLGFLWWL